MLLAWQHQQDLTLKVTAERDRLSYQFDELRHTHEALVRDYRDVQIALAETRTQIAVVENEKTLLDGRRMEAERKFETLAEIHQQTLQQQAMLEGQRRASMLTSTV
ncbi:MAG: hypothetical protein HY308_11265 [Gammaproteobacteria bacterium]|nr:hypothetical protein [Gammaproteobacteria bacterium]